MCARINLWRGRFVGRPSLMPAPGSTGERRRRRSARRFSSVC